MIVGAMDFFSPEIRRNPFPAYAQLRATSPVLHEPHTDAWMIFDYAGAKQALNDHERFSSSMFTAGRGNPEWMIFLDPPRQAKLRSLIGRAFTPKAIAALEPRIRALTHELLDALVARGEMDIVAEFATPLPMIVIAEMIGVPAAGWPRFRRWSDVILKLSHTISAGAAADAAAAGYFAVHTEMGAYLAILVEDRRREPKDDLLSRLVHAEVDGDWLTEAEILGFVELLIVAGQETTSNLIANAVLCLLENPEQFAGLIRSPELLSKAIEEVLRYRSPVQWIFRATRCEVTLHGQTIPAGKLVLPIIGSANRDLQVFPDPDRFDIARDPNPHISFGHGIHYCLGAPLARLEASTALLALFSRLKRMELASADPWQPRDALHVLGPDSLPIHFEPSSQKNNLA
jgi:cytochrome P450